MSKSKNEYLRQYYLKNIDRLKAARKEYYFKNKKKMENADKVRKYQREYMAKYRERMVKER